MNKIKYIEKKGEKKLIIKSDKGQQLNENEIYSINMNEISGLLPIEVERKGNSFKLFYCMTGLISLNQYLINPLSKESFSRFLQNVLDCLLMLKKNYFNQNKLLLDLNYIVVNPTSQKLYFPYVPVHGFENNTNLRNFLINVANICSFETGEDNSYFQDYINLLNNGFNFSEFELEEYVKKINSNEVNITEMVTCPYCHKKLRPGTNFCTQCGNKLDAGINTNDSKYYYADNDEVISGVLYTGYTQNISEGTTVLGSEELEGLMEKWEAPYLINIKNNEKIVINKSPFIIGRSQNYSDYALSSNNVVSKKHAQIDIVQDRYYITDLNSTNKTFVNGEIIEPQQQIELANETKLRLANEEFIFYIGK